MGVLYWSIGRRWVWTRCMREREAGLCSRRCRLTAGAVALSGGLVDLDGALASGLAGGRTGVVCLRVD